MKSPLPRAALLLLLAAFSQTPQQSRAQSASDLLFFPGSGGVKAGMTAGYGACPCFRWTVAVRTGGFEIETKSFLITSDQLFEYVKEETALAALNDSKELFNAGAVRLLHKGAHLGIGFSGITWGEDLDKSYTNLFKTGAFLLVNLIRTDAARLDLHNGYEFERMRVNDGNPIRRHFLPQTVRLSFEKYGFSGSVAATVALNAEQAFESMDYVHLIGLTHVRRKLFKVKTLETGLSLDFKFEHDPLQNEFGLAADQATGAVYLDVTYIPRKKGKRRAR